MNKEFVSTVYNYLGNLNFGLLPKLIKSKQTPTNNNSTATDISWNKFLQSLIALSNAEQAYYKFTYLSTKNSNLQDIYGVILNDLRIISNINSKFNSNQGTAVAAGGKGATAGTSTPTKDKMTITSPTGNSTPLSMSSDDQNPEHSFFVALILQTCIILQVRIDMIGVYSAILSSINNSDVSLENIGNSLELIPVIYKDKITHPLLLQIKSNTNYEISILRNLLRVQILLSKHIFKDCILLLFQSKIELDSWREMDQGGSSGSRSNSSSNDNRWASNHIHQWLFLFYNSLLSKSTLFFHFPLKNVEEEIGGNGQSFREISQKNSPDYISIIENFCVKTNALFFGVIRDCQETVYSSIGYSFIDNQVQTGLKAFPLLFYYPMDPKQSPMQHMPNIIGLILENRKSPTVITTPSNSGSGGSSSNSNASSTNANVTDIYYYLDTRKVRDPQRSTFVDEYLSYFISKVDPHLFLCLIFKEVRKQKDQSINDFLKLLTNSLKNIDIFSILSQKDQNK
ncbi:hypothetical protein CYY_002900 [Polysphondylium violaceum]|uniref:Uncharacterized protein n=1 Tax=Polysphondylium violaceum TaxID=133409 RepID=A0A8J4PZF6_9MYCE|nr:hypothetical protein CYY_002900 [Polysphondylium violaceum]